MTRGRRQPRWVTAATALAMLLSAGLLTAAGVVISNAATVPDRGGGGFLSVIGTAEPTGETPPIADDASDGDTATSPAIWVNPSVSAASLVFGTVQGAGMVVFDLHGRQIQRVTPGDGAGRLNDVDVLYDVPTGKGRSDLAVVTRPDSDRLRIFSIDAKAATAGRPPLTDITDPSAPPVFSTSGDRAASVGLSTQGTGGTHTVNGIAGFRIDERAMLLLTREHAAGLGLVRLVAKAGRMTYEVVRTVRMPATVSLPDGSAYTPCQRPDDSSQPEGLVIDSTMGVAYLAQRGVGLWRMDATLEPFEPQLVDPAREYGVPATFDAATDSCVADGADPGFGGEHLSDGPTGLAIYHRDDDQGYLMASSRGDDTFAVYDLSEANAFLGSYRVGDGVPRVDGVQANADLAVTNVAVGAFANGLAVFADGADTPQAAGAAPHATNFKLVPWENVADAFNPPLDVDPGGFDPRA